jgi:hypothetical protein
MSLMALDLWDATQNEADLRAYLPLVRTVRRTVRLFSNSYCIAMCRFECNSSGLRE